MSSFKFTVELQQHTPLIHFQHDQAGATLRATEVKAKLDRYLVSKKGGWENIPKLWKVNPEAKDNQALNYRLNIKSGRKMVRDPERIAKGYFGNMGDGHQAKFLVESPEIRLNFFCLLSDLSDLINKNISAFFLEHNFGSRQNRGYGSFTKLDETSRPSKALFAFQVYDDYYTSARDLPLSLVTMEAIDWFYRSLRQGINHGRFDRASRSFIPFLYMKPMLFQYAASKGVQWEKKTIKEWFFSGQLTSQQNDPSKITGPDASALFYSSPQKKLVRDLFGLSTEQSWMNYPNPGRQSSVTKSDPLEEIERFPSPIKFKPVQHPNNDFMTVYFWVDPIPEKYLNSSFKIKVNNQDNQHPLMEIWKDFDFNQFFGFAFKEGQLESSIHLEGDEGLPVQELLENIYQDIRENNFTHV